MLHQVYTYKSLGNLMKNKEITRWNNYPRIIVFRMTKNYLILFCSIKEVIIEKLKKQLVGNGCVVLKKNKSLCNFRSLMKERNEAKVEG